MFYRASGSAGAIGCGLTLAFLGLFLLTPVAVLLIKSVGWILLVMGAVVVGLGVWAWLRQR